MIEDKNATKSNTCTTKTKALKQLVEKLPLEVGEAATERKMIIEYVASIKTDY